jgi:hypothetical protein
MSTIIDVIYRTRKGEGSWKDYVVANVSKNDRILGEGQLAIMT